jgi:hypothetical protein
MAPHKSEKIKELLTNNCKNVTMTGTLFADARVAKRLSQTIGFSRKPDFRKRQLLHVSE